MYNIEEEQRKMGAENQARVFYFMSHHAFQMHQLLKCTICLDVYEKPTTVFHCFHVFCEDCIKTYLDYLNAKEPPCPICQQPILRTDLRPYSVLEKVAEFVRFAQERIDGTLGCNVSKPPLFETILTKIKEKKKTETSPQTDGVKPNSPPPPDYSFILKARKILIGANNQVISTTEDIPHELPSVSFRDGSLKTPTSIRRNSVATHTTINRNKVSNKNDLFDVVKASPAINPFFRRNRLDEVTKTYQKQPKNGNTSRSTAFADKIIQFEDDSNKMKIIEWLSDSRNKFDSIPLTQQINVPESETPFNMPSVSQRHTHKVNPANVPQLSQINRQKLEQNKIREKSELVTHLSRINSCNKNNNRRTRSLECYVEIAKPNQKLKRHSISVAEKITIEEVNSEEEVLNPVHTTIINLMEEECLDSIEAEVLQRKSKGPVRQTKKLAEGLSSPKRSKRLSSNSSKLEQTNKQVNKNSSGWARMKEIKNTIKKVEVKPKKLRVSGVSRCSSTVTSTVKDAEGSNRTYLETSKAGKQKVGEPVVYLERMNFDVIKPKTKAYDLDEMESYFSKQMEKPQKEEGKTKNEAAPASSASSRKQVDLCGTASNAMKKLIVTAVVHSTNQYEPKNISSKIDWEKKLKSNREEPKNNSKRAKKATDELVTSNKNEKGDSKMLKDAIQSNLDQIARVARSSSSSSIFNRKSADGKLKNNSKEVNKASYETFKIEKEKSKMLKDARQSKLDHITGVAHSSSSFYTSNRKFEDGKLKNNSKQNEETSANIEKEKLKLLEEAGPSNLDQITRVTHNSPLSTFNRVSEDGKSKTQVEKETEETFTSAKIGKENAKSNINPNSSLSSTSSQKFEDSKLIKKASGDVPTPISTDEIENPKPGEDTSKARMMGQIAIPNLSTNSGRKSRKRLFDDYRTQNESVKKTLVTHQSNDKLKEKDKSPSPTTSKQKSNLATLSTEEKSVLDVQKFTEEAIEVTSNRQSNNSTAKVDPNLKIDDYDDLFMLPTQDILGREAKKSEEIFADDEIFTMATQEVVLKDTNTCNIFAPKDNSFEDVLKLKIQSLQELLSTPNFTSKMKLLLHDIGQTISKEESQHHPETNKLVNDAQAQTDSFCMHDSTTQTAFPKEKLQHIAIQTDSCDSPRGFQISSTELFQTRPLTNTEMQTDVMTCPKCSHLLGSNSKISLLNNPTAISSNALLSDSNIVGSSSEKYVLSTSFDHIDFETQDVIKGKYIRGSSASPKGSAQIENGQNKENKTQNQNETERKEILLDSGLFQRPKLSLTLTSQKSSKTPNKKSFKRIRKPSSDSDSDDELSKNAKKNNFFQDNLSLHFASETQDKITQSNVKKSEEEDDFLLSGESEGVNYREYLQNVLKKCDEELMSKKSAPIQKPASVEPPPKRPKTQDIIEECKQILQDACSGAITIENTEKFTDARQEILKPTKLTLAALEQEFQHDFGQDNMMELDPDCRHSINVDPDTEKDKDVEMKVEARNKFSESLFSSTGNFSKTTDNTPVSSQASARLAAHNRSKNGVKKVIADEAGELLTESSLDYLVDAMEEFDNSFEDDSASKEKSAGQNNDTAVKVENGSAAENINEKEDRVKILQNIVVAKSNAAVKGTSTDAEEKGETVDRHNESGDMFLSDSDVVETTPQKHKPVSLERISLLSQAYYNPEEKIVLPPLVDESPDIIMSLDPPPLTCLGEVFIPPPEFQDSPTEEETVVENKEVEINRMDDGKIKLNEAQTNDPISIIDLTDTLAVHGIKQISAPSLSSLTPDLLLPRISQPDCNDSNAKEPFMTSTPYLEHSQILPTKSLNLSPISVKEPNKTVNAILAAQTAKFSPLNVVRSKTPPPRRYSILATSTPKQKSMLNYLNANTSFTRSELGSQPSQKSGLDKKPCVAFTRMSKEQLMAIISLSNRKLISYSNTFTSGITHMIVDVNQQNCVKDHTMKFVSAVAAGIWVLNFCWVEECLKHNRILSEEPFEALDMSGIPGPRQSRLARATSPLLRGYKIHAAPPFKSTTQKEVENVIKLLGGQVVPRLDDLIPSNGKVHLIITEAKESEDFDMYEAWLDMLKVITVDLEWLSRSVGQYELLSLKPFILCSEESICDLGYPTELLADVPISFSHSTT